MILVYGLIVAVLIGLLLYFIGRPYRGWGSGAIRRVLYVIWGFLLVPAQLFYFPAVIIISIYQETRWWLRWKLKGIRPPVESVLGRWQLELEAISPVQNPSIVEDQCTALLDVRAKCYEATDIFGNWQIGPVVADPYTTVGWEKRKGFFKGIVDANARIEVEIRDESIHWVLDKDGRWTVDRSVGTDEAEITLKGQVDKDEISGTALIVPSDGPSIALNFNGVRKQHRGPEYN